MKKIIYILLISIVSFSCSKSKDTVKETNCRVSSMDDYAYTYNASNQLVKVENALQSVEFTYSNNKIVAVKTFKSSSNKQNETFTLDNQGRVSKYVGVIKTLDVSYNADGYIAEIKYHDTTDGSDMGTATFTYQNGNLVKINRIYTGINEETTISYTDIPNKANNGWYVNLALLQATYFASPELISLWGKQPKNLPKETNFITVGYPTSATKDVWTFTLNENGYVTTAAFKYTTMQSQQSFEDKFNFGYQCN